MLKKLILRLSYLKQLESSDIWVHKFDIYRIKKLYGEVIDLYTLGY